MLFARDGMLWAMRAWHRVKVVLGALLFIVSPALPFVVLQILVATLGCLNGEPPPYHCRFLGLDLNQDVQSQMGGLSWWLYATVPLGVLFLVFCCMRWLWRWVRDG
ncbi:hypothetical protein MF271_23830 (plasmid) [Deinococcus sp. KNUC1210]|uniref:hypothetical protein n=1 Tax=Deinococcus sp. KNUC1210 TaxID=2917691 RepID=UPI001EF0D333|nr:hypothetical protein [Deinococcus sp. KNUC1210]ULH17994.1 hypothetical protein MF271_23830 [Deinococcus sp. KNUC1210]